MKPRNSTFHPYIFFSGQARLPKKSVDLAPNFRY